ncbi:hypothetical protein Trydic_g14524 [Trypoxylus dichotomus]
MKSSEVAAVDGTGKGTILCSFLGFLEPLGQQKNALTIATLPRIEGVRPFAASTVSASTKFTGDMGDVERNRRWEYRRRDDMQAKEGGRMEFEGWKEVEIIAVGVRRDAHGFEKVED